MTTHLRSRRPLLVALAGALICSIGAIVPASATTTRWTCGFGPANSAPEFSPPMRGSARFSFRSPRGLGNDSVTIDGTGACSRSPRSDPVNATIHGEGHDYPYTNSLEFGRCDGDAASPTVTGRGLSVEVDVSITIGTKKLARHLSLQPSYVHHDFFGLQFLQDPFPGPNPHKGVILNGDTTEGGVTMFARIADKCPPDGSDSATFFRMTVVT